MSLIADVDIFTLSVHTLIFNMFSLFSHFTPSPSPIACNLQMNANNFIQGGCKEENIERVKWVQKGQQINENRVTIYLHDTCSNILFRGNIIYNYRYLSENVLIYICDHYLYRGSDCKGNSGMSLCLSCDQRWALFLLHEKCLLFTNYVIKCSKIFIKAYSKVGEISSPSYRSMLILHNTHWPLVIYSAVLMNHINHQSG